MKRTCKIMSLLLVAVMVLALLPTAAFADPPQSDPTHKHNWKLVSDTATCTKAGKRTWKCSVCGQTYSEKSPAKGHKWDNGKVTKAATCEQDGGRTYTCSRCNMRFTKAIPALGHDWDEGAVTTEPHLFTPGVKTYTCKRDASHTYTEEIDPSPWLFATLEGVTIDFTTFDLATKDLTPLVITEQPKGGSITRDEDETVALTCAASGGTGDYTYEWKYRPTYNSTIGNIISWTFLKTSGKQTQPDFDAPDGNHKYWCVVTDEVGNSVYSDTVIVSYKVRIAKQPDNVNLQSDNTSFHCEAADGSGSYTYRWYDSDMGILGEGQSLPATEPGICYCYCIVTDDITGETATSEYCEVYSEPPLTLTSITEDQEIWPGDYCPLTATFTGGVEDYEIWWDRDGQAIDSTDGVDGHTSYANAAAFGTYTVHIVDSMHEVLTASCHITEKHLTIAKQPQGGNLPDKNAPLLLTVEMKDGTAPFEFDLLYNGKYLATNKENSYTGEFNAWEPGFYSIYVTDAKGRTVESDTVYVEDSIFRVVNQSETAEIKNQGEDVSLKVEVAGGTGPFTYTWTIHKSPYWYKIRSYQIENSNGGAAVDQIGTYSCKITDADNQSIHSKNINVIYTGIRPYIVEQPQSSYKAVEADGKVVEMLRCIAISGTGNDDNLIYDWYDGNGKLVYSDSRTFYTKKAGEYRCMVMDAETGGYTYSETAVVSPELRNLRIEKFAEIAQGWGEFHMEFKGGTGPYTVNTYTVTEDRDCVLYDTQRIKGHFARLYLPLWQNRKEATYYFEVVDNYGRSVEAGPITW